jgi:hypothetical protein
MVRRLALSTPQILAAGISLILAVAPVWAQPSHQGPADTPNAQRSDPGLSAECLVPDAQLFALAPLEVVKAALDEKRPVKGSGPRVICHERARDGVCELPGVAGA